MLASSSIFFSAQKWKMERIQGLAVEWERRRGEGGGRSAGPRAKLGFAEKCPNRCGIGLQGCVNSRQRQGPHTVSPHLLVHLLQPGDELPKVRIPPLAQFSRHPRGLSPPASTLPPKPLSTTPFSVARRCRSPACLWFLAGCTPTQSVSSLSPGFEAVCKI
jgi:hypothetical protein